MCAPDVAPGTAVHAARDGNVIYSDTLRGYGNVVILDHGGDHFTVSAHLDRIDVRPGDLLVDDEGNFFPSPEALQLFDEVYDAVGEYADLLAERVVQLGGTAEGTARVAAQRTTLMDYPLTITTGGEHVAALSDVLAQFGRSARMGIEEMNDLEDAGSADILTEISRGVDKWLWFVEAHVQAER